jgi:predicted nucleic acid-binding Zn ribbon protein
MSENRDLARSLLAAARRRSNRYKREQEKSNTRRSTNERSSSESESSEYQGPQLLNESLAELINERGWRERVKDSDLFLQWGELVGSELADHVQPIAFTDGILTVSAESTAWATQLRLIDQRVISALTQGGFEVQELRIKGPQAPSWRKGGWSVKGGRGPRDTYG